VQQTIITEAVDQSKERLHCCESEQQSFKKIYGDIFTHANAY